MKPVKLFEQFVNEDMIQPDAYADDFKKFMQSMLKKSGENDMTPDHYGFVLCTLWDVHMKKAKLKNKVGRLAIDLKWRGYKIEKGRMLGDLDLQPLAKRFAGKWERHNFTKGTYDGIAYCIKRSIEVNRYKFLDNTADTASRLFW